MVCASRGFTVHASAVPYARMVRKCIEWRKLFNVQRIILILKDLTTILRIMRVVRRLTTFLQLCVVNMLARQRPGALARDMRININFMSRLFVEILPLLQHRLPSIEPRSFSDTSNNALPIRVSPQSVINRLTIIAHDIISANGQSTCIGTYRPGFDSRWRIS